MTKKTRAILGVLIGVPAFVGLTIFAGWEISLCVILMMWADNISRG